MEDEETPTSRSGANQNTPRIRAFNKGCSRSCLQKVFPLSWPKRKLAMKV